MKDNMRFMILLSVAAGVICWGSMAEAATTCLTCHAPVGSSTDIRPVDAAYRNLSTGGFKGSHGKHIPTATTAVSTCAPCHVNAASYSTKHRNGFIHVSSVGYSKGKSFAQSGAPTSGTCSTASCHDNGKGTLVVTPTWGASTVPACTACHNLIPVDSSHARHVTGTQYKKALCGDCHTGYVQGTTAAANHLNGTIEVNVGGYTSPKAKGSAVASCATSYCHSSGQSANGTSATPVYAATAPTWGGTVACGSCHATTGLTTGSHDKHLAVSTNCGSCHTGATDSAYNSTSHVDGQINVASGFSYTNQANPGNGYSSCSTTVCHGSAITPVWGVATTQSICTKCHGVSLTSAAAYTADPKTAAPGYNGTGVNTAGTVGTISGGVSNDAKVGAHDTHLKGTGGYKTGGVACADCHLVTALGDAGHMTGSSTMTWSNLAKNVGTTPYNADKGAIVPTYSAPTCTTNYCHGGGFASLVQGTGLSASWVDGAYLVNAAAVKNATDCNKCHQSPPTSSVKYAHASLTIASDCAGCHGHNGSGATHMDGILQATGGDCTSCHNSQQGTGGYRRKVVGSGGDFFTNISTHVKFTTMSQQTCIVCHDNSQHQSFSDGISVKLNNLDGSASVVYDGTAATAPAVKGTCISCHNAGGATSLGANALKPFTDSGDNKAPANINQYWPATGGAHDTKMVCFNCHGNSKGVDGLTTNPKYNAHASGAKHMLQDAGYDVLNPNNYCFNCHNAASTDPNKSTKDIAGEMAKTYKHTTAKCFDCHGDEANSLDSMHSMKAGSQTAGSGVIAKNLSNATGRSLTWSATNWGGATASASLASNTVTAEFQICIKCHAAVGTGTTPDVPGAGTAAASLTNLALDFNPNNASGHPVVTGLNNYPNSVAPKALTAAKMKAPWNVNLGTQTMTCSDCHATDTAASKGPHGSSVKWMLAGTNKAWPYTTTANNGGSTGTLFRVATYNTNIGTANGLFCLNCHVVTASNNWHAYSDVSGGEHGGDTIMACVSCHIRIPHGGKISRLLQTTNAPARYRSNGSTAASNWDYWGGAGGIKNSAFSNANFNSSCSRHNSGTGEAW